MALKVCGIVVLLVNLPVNPTSAQKLFVDAGRIFFQAASNSTPKQLTDSGSDSEPALSSDQKAIVFVRRTPGVTVSTGLGDQEATELWIIRADGRDLRRLLRGRSGSPPESTLAKFSNPQFSPDSKRIYFTSEAWVTSPAIHMLELSSGKERFLTAGNLIEIINRGEYKNNLIVGQHRYFLAGGSYDWIWLITPDG